MRPPTWPQVVVKALFTPPRASVRITLSFTSTQFPATTWPSSAESIQDSPPCPRVETKSEGEAAALGRCQRMLLILSLLCTVCHVVPPSTERYTPLVGSAYPVALWWKVATATRSSSAGSTAMLPVPAMFSPLTEVQLAAAFVLL